MRKRLTTVLAGVAALIATSFALAPGASADAFRCGTSGSDPRAWCAYVQKAPNGLTIRSGPGTGYSAVGTVNNGTKLEIDCWTYGTSVNGYTIWARLYSPLGLKYVSDYYLTTGHVQSYVSKCI